MPKARDDISNRFPPTIVNYFSSWTSPTSTPSTDFLPQSRFNKGRRASDRARRLELSVRFKIFCGCCLLVSASRFALNAAPESRFSTTQQIVDAAHGASTRRAHRSCWLRWRAQKNWIPMNCSANFPARASPALELTADCTSLTKRFTSEEGRAYQIDLVIDRLTIRARDGKTPSGFT